jgi:WD40 repeat protein
MRLRFLFLAAGLPLVAAFGMAAETRLTTGVDAFGDPLPAGAVARMGSIRLRPEGPVIGAAFSPDGKSLLTVGQTSHIQVWEAETGRQRRRIALTDPAGPGPAPGAVMVWGGFAAFTPDGKTLAVQGTDGQMRIYDTDGGKLRHKLTNAGPQYPQRLSLSNDGKRLAVKQQDSNVTIWNTEEAKTLASVTGLQPNGMAALTPDGKHLVASWADGSCRVADAETGREVRKLETGYTVQENRNPYANRMVLSSDSKLAIFASGSGHTMITSLETGKSISTITSSFGYAQGMALSPNNRFLALGVHPGARIFGLASGKELRHLEAIPPTYCSQLVYSADGKRLAGIGQDGSIRIWDVLSSRPVYRSSGHTAAVTGMVFLRDGMLVSAANDGRLIAWDSATGKQLHQHQGMPFNAMTMTSTPDGTAVQGVGYDRSLHIWHPGGELERLPGNEGPINGYQSAVSRDGKRWVVVSNPDQKVRLFGAGIKEREGRVLPKPDNVWVNMMQFSPDGSRVMAVASDGVFRVWDCASGHEIRAFAQENNMGWGPHMRFTPDGRGILMDNGEMRLYEIASGRKRASFSSPTPNCTALTCSDDSRLAARGNIDGSITVYSLLTGAEVAHFDGSQGQVQSLAFSSDGRLLASGGANGLILVWKLPAAPAAAAATLTAARKTTLWNELADLDGERSARALGALLEAPGPAIELIRERLKFTTVAVDRKRLEQLVADLDSDEFTVREKASAALTSAGAAAEKVMREALEKSPSPEVRRRLQELLSHFDDKGAAPEHLRAVRAVELLERIGTPPARELLTKLLGEVKEPTVETEVRDSLRRLGEPATPAPPK